MDSQIGPKPSKCGEVVVSYMVQSKHQMVYLQAGQLLRLHATLALKVPIQAKPRTMR
jgi:hypothetical protein